MPHDLLGEELQAGDHVFMVLKVKSIDSDSPTGCNVTLEAVYPDDMPSHDEYLPVLVCNSKLTLKLDDDELEEINETLEECY